MAHGEGLREMGVLKQKRRLKGILPTRVEDEPFFSVVSSDRMARNGHKLKCRNST